MVASLALLAGLSGTSYAAVTLARNSVGAIHIRSGAVGSPEVRDASLAAVDLAPAARRALRGPVGPQGPQGPAGPQGEAGPPGLAGVETRTGSSFFDSISPKTLVVSCPAGKRILGGGGGAWGRAMVSVPPGVALTANHPLHEEDASWLVAARELEPTEESWFLRATVICAAAG